MNNPFEIISQLNATTADHYDDIGDKTYTTNAFMIDRGMSYFLDSIMLAAEITQRHHMPPQWKYDFYRFAIQPKKSKKFAKWAKQQKDDDIDLIMQAYNVNRRKATQIRSTINNDMSIIRETMNFGGK